MTDDDFEQLASSPRKKPAISLKARALRYLSQREHSRAELARKLTPYLMPEDDLEALLNALEAAQYLSNVRFSEALVRRRSARYGNGRILAELHSHGIEGESLSQAKEQLQQDELQRAHELWQRKFGALAESREEQARQYRFLMQRGFSSAVVRQVLRGIDEE